MFRGYVSFIMGFLRGGMVIPLMFPKVPQSSLGILRVPQLPPPQYELDGCLAFFPKNCQVQKLKEFLKFLASQAEKERCG